MAITILKFIANHLLNLRWKKIWTISTIQRKSKDMSYIYGPVHLTLSPVWMGSWEYQFMDNGHARNQPHEIISSLDLTMLSLMVFYNHRFFLFFPRFNPTSNKDLMSIKLDVVRDHRGIIVRKDLPLSKAYKSGLHRAGLHMLFTCRRIFSWHNFFHFCWIINFSPWLLLI